MNTAHAEGESAADPRQPGPPKLVVIGAGISGLAAAWFARQAAARAGMPLRLTVLEAGDRCGGKLWTDEVSGFGTKPFRMEASADGFLVRKPWALALAVQLGLDDEVLYSRPETANTRVWHAGALTPLPAGLTLLPPTRLMPFLRSPLFSARGKVRALLELALPPAPPAGDESLSDFVRRRFGTEMLDRVAVPLMAGVYNARPERMSLRATFPQFAEWERTHGSVTRGARRVRALPSAQSATPAALFFSFVGGARRMVEVLSSRLDDAVRLGVAVRAIEPAQGGGYVIRPRKGAPLAADAVIVATSATVAADLLRDAAPDSATLLRAIRYESIGALYLGYRQTDLPGELAGYGVLIPAGERKHIDGITWTSSKWHERAPEGFALLRVFFGGPFTRDSLGLDDERLLPLVTRELAGMLGITAPPVMHRAYRWVDGYPQYDVGHVDRVEALTRSLPAGLTIAGNAYRGVGVPDCVRQGEQAAEQVVGQLLERTLAASWLTVGGNGADIGIG
jgi:protoporphyrinogen/coproporphyrinogen III oxidase